jgi:hypothetical protein
MKSACCTLLIISLCVFIVSPSAFAAAPTPTPTPVITSTSDISILPLSGPNMNDVVVDSQMTLNGSGNDTTYLDINVYCYGTNLRAVSNPLSPASTVTAQIQYQAADKTYKYYNIKFPATMVSKDQTSNKDLTSDSFVSSDAEGVNVTDKFKAYIKDGNIHVEMKRTRSVGVDLLSTKSDFGKLVDLNEKSNLIKGIRFLQDMPPGTPAQQFMGWTGPLTASITWYASENGKQIKVNAGFPGENRYCGGYFSPLVLKFKSPEKLPGLSKSSHFVLNTSEMKLPGGPKRISWPDFNEETYFLAIDSNNNGKIENGSELFGDVNGYENGFANLADHDDNKDGVIDDKDRIFSKLLLWKDSNHDGVTQKAELKKLSSMRVVSISLTYEKSLRDIGRSGRILGPGVFTFTDKKGTLIKGSVWDIFLVGMPN